MAEERIEQEQLHMLEELPKEEQDAERDELQKELKAPDAFIEDDRAVACGYRFMSAEDADMAIQEENAVKYLKQHMKFQDAEHLKKVYHNAIQARTFQTPVGLRFLQQIREQMLKLGVPEEEIIPVPVLLSYVRRESRRDDPSAQKKLEEQKKRRMDRLTTSVLLNVALVILVIAMFYITMKSDNANILNYRNAILDEYSSWEEDLTAKDAQLRERERALENAGQ
ncbi:MAG: hypothetical protein K6G23_04240 [Lachnospiraceae bacterium]|nr:hypothetical protein [Lachnospiraceae bacterium]